MRDLRYVSITSQCSASEFTFSAREAARILSSGIQSKRKRLQESNVNISEFKSAENVPEEIVTGKYVT